MASGCKKFSRDNDRTIIICGTIINAANERVPGIRAIINCLLLDHCCSYGYQGIIKGTVEGCLIK